MATSGIVCSPSIFYLVSTRFPQTWPSERPFGISRSTSRHVRTPPRRTLPHFTITTSLHRACVYISTYVVPFTFSCSSYKPRFVFNTAIGEWQSTKQRFMVIYRDTSGKDVIPHVKITWKCRIFHTMLCFRKNAVW